MNRWRRLNRLCRHWIWRSNGIAHCLNALSFNTSELEEVEERLFAIRGLARKHDVMPDDLSGFADELRARLAMLDDSAGALATLQSAVDQAVTAYEDAAAAFDRQADRGSQGA